MPSVEKGSHSSLRSVTTDGEFFPLCALLSIHAKAFLAGARWNHHHDEHAWEEGCCCTGLPKHLGSRRAEELNEQSQPAPARAGAQNPSDLQDTEQKLQQKSSRRRLCGSMQHVQPHCRFDPPVGWQRMVLAPDHHLAAAP